MTAAPPPPPPPTEGPNLAPGHYGQAVHAGDWARGTLTVWEGRIVPKRTLCGYTPWGPARRTNRPVTCATCLKALARRSGEAVPNA